MRDLLHSGTALSGTVLVLVLMAIGLAYWWVVDWGQGRTMDEVLDALAPAEVSEVAPLDTYERFARRDYGGDRGAVPTGPPPATIGWVPVGRDLYAETCQRLGFDPCAG